MKLICGMWECNLKLSFKLCHVTWQLKSGSQCPFMWLCDHGGIGGERERDLFFLSFFLAHFGHWSGVSIFCPQVFNGVSLLTNDVWQLWLPKLRFLLFPPRQSPFCSRLYIHGVSETLKSHKFPLPWNVFNSSRCSLSLNFRCPVQLCSFVTVTVTVMWSIKLIHNVIYRVMHSNIRPLAIIIVYAFSRTRCCSNDSRFPTQRFVLRNCSWCHMAAPIRLTQLC